MTDPTVFTSVSDVGLAANKNAPHRRKMEDTHTIIDKYQGKDDQGFFGVYDGHGGVTTSQFCADKLHLIFDEFLSSVSSEELTSEKFQEVATNVFSKADDEIRLSIPCAGACVAVALIRSRNDQPHLYVANAGDTRIVIQEKEENDEGGVGKAVRLTVDHKPESCPEDVERIKSINGFIDANNRVNGMVAVTRALGDINMKPEGKAYLSSVPHTATVPLEKKHGVIIIACDGVWDVITDDEGLSIVVNAEGNAKAKALALIKEAKQKGSTDNLSAIVILRN